MTSLRRFAAVFLVSALGLTLGGCTPATSPDGAGAAKTIFKINVDTWIGYAPLRLAQEKGFFEDIDVQLITTPDVAQRKLILARGENQAIAETVDMLVLDRDEGVPTVAVMGLDFSNGADGIVATEEVKTIQDLKGKTVLVQKNYPSESLLNYLLEKNGIPFSDVKTVDTEAGAAGAAFVAGKTDAAVTFEPWLSKAKERGNGHILLSSKDAPGVIVDILSVQDQYLKDHPDVVAKVVRGWFRAVEEWTAHPDESNAIMAKHYQVTPEEFAEQVAGLRWPLLQENIAYFDSKSESNIYGVADTFVQIFLKTGQIKKMPDMTGAIDTSVLQSLHAQQ